MKNELILNENEIESKIFTIRGMQVMLDRDLAELYEVETKRLNEQVKRNKGRFPESFSFQLIESEVEIINSQSKTSINECSRSQFATLNKPHQKRGKNIKYLPYVFTEQGIAMLSAVLRSETAIQVSVQIINAFISMRRFIFNNAQVFQRLDTLELRQIETDKEISYVLDTISSKEKIPTQGIFFDGQIFDAYEFASKLIRSAKEKIILIDNYIDESSLITLAKKKENVKIVLLTTNISKQLELDVQKINAQYKNFEIRNFEKSHDRFLIIDNTEIYHLGASLKDLGKKWFAFSKLESDFVEKVLWKLR